MIETAFVTLILTAAVVGTVAWLVNVRRRGQKMPHEAFQTRSAIRVLATEDELRAAVKRAIACERAAASRVETRIDRYSGIATTHTPRVAAMTPYRPWD